MHSTGWTVAVATVAGLLGQIGDTWPAFYFKGMRVALCALPCLLQCARCCCVCAPGELVASRGGEWQRGWHCHTARHPQRHVCLQEPSVVAAAAPNDAAARSSSSSSTSGC